MASYIDPLFMRSERQQLLQARYGYSENSLREGSGNRTRESEATSPVNATIKLNIPRYNFTCTCPVCQLADEALAQNEKIRYEIIGLTNNMLDVYDKSAAKALRYAKMRLERMEKLRREMVAALPQVKHEPSHILTQ